MSGAGADAKDPRAAQVLFLDPQSDGRVHALIVRLPVAQLTPGEHAMHGFETNVIFVDLDPNAPDDVRIIGFGGGGSVTLDAATTDRGGAIEGRFAGEFIQIARF